jgi:hypothetical protein
MRKTRPLLFHFLFAAGIFAGLLADFAGPVAEGKLPPDLRKAVLRSGAFHEIQTTKEIPAPIMGLCAQHRERMAEPGQKWQVTDVITEPNLPIERLIFAATDGVYYVVHYERGGIAHSFEVVVAELPKGQGRPVAVWRGNGGPFKDFAALQEWLKQN